MSEEEKNIQNILNKKDNLEVTEEKIGNIRVLFSVVFKIYTERILDKGEDNLLKFILSSD